MKYLVLIIAMMTVTECEEYETSRVVDILGNNDAVSLAKKSCPKKVRYEGQFYNTVEVGNQCWIQENLNVGTMVTGPSAQSNNSQIEKYCYNDDPASCETYGGLYTWEEAMQYTVISESQGICPKHWHIPTAEDFEVLKETVNGEANALKAVGQGPGTNSSGFTSLLTGFWDWQGTFVSINGHASYWSSSVVVHDDIYANMLQMTSEGNFITIGGFPRDYGLSVRCIWDR